MSSSNPSYYTSSSWMDARTSFTNADNQLPGPSRRSGSTYGNQTWDLSPYSNLFSFDNFGPFFFDPSLSDADLWNLLSTSLNSPPYDDRLQNQQTSTNYHHRPNPSYSVPYPNSIPYQMSSLAASNTGPPVPRHQITASIPASIYEGVVDPFVPTAVAYSTSGNLESTLHMNVVPANRSHVFSNGEDLYGLRHNLQGHKGYIGRNQDNPRSFSSSTNSDTTRALTQASRQFKSHPRSTGVVNPEYHTSMFSGNRKVEVNGGSFAINMASPDAGFLLLARAASTDAMHDSSARSPPPKCHPETRKKVMAFVLKWIKNCPASKSVFWLYSPFGHGKSAVMQTIMDILVEENLRQLFAGGFFFGRDRDGRDKIIYLFATIAYQIALNIPGMREHINAAMLADPTLPSKSADIQLRYLIIDPLLKSTDSLHFYHSPTVFIDGLDECDTIDSQVTILQLITSALRNHNVPLRFVIASRPEAHIRSCFDQFPLNNISERLNLPDNTIEMTKYVRTAFDKIYTNHARTMCDIQRPWPTNAVIDDLVRRASGQYVFIDTVLRFVGAHRHNPASQLDIVLDRLSDESIFSDMDSIYRLILEQCPHMYRQIQEAILDTLVSDNVMLQTPPCIADIWQLPIVDVRHVVEALAAIVEYKTEYDMLAIHHLSFIEFLESESRSGTFFCDRSLAEERVETHCKETYRLVLTGKLLLKDPASLGALKFGITPLVSFTTPELMELIHQGQPREISRSDACFQWYFMVEYLTEDVINWLQIENLRIAKHDMQAMKELYNECVRISKSIANRGFISMDPRLVNAILDADHKSFYLTQLATAAGMNEEDCLHQLNEHKKQFRDERGFDVDDFSDIQFRLESTPHFLFGKQE